MTNPFIAKLAQYIRNEVLAGLDIKELLDDDMDLDTLLVAVYLAGKTEGVKAARELVRMQ